MTNLTKARLCAAWGLAFGLVGTVLSVAFCSHRAVVAFNGTLLGATLPLVWLVWFRPPGSRND